MTIILKPKKPEPEYGQLRTRSFYALWPVKIGDRVKWLERVSVLESFTRISRRCFKVREWEKKNFI